MNGARNKSTLAAWRARWEGYVQVLPSLDLKRRHLAGLLAAERRAWQRSREALEGALTETALRLPHLVLAMPPRLSARAREEADRVHAAEAQESKLGVRMPRLSGDGAVEVAAQPGHAWATPAWHDEAAAALEVLLKRQREVQQRALRVAALEAGLRRTVQRVNLFERQLIPHAEAAMRDIRLHLADLEREAVVRAKLARARLQAARGELA